MTVVDWGSVGSDIAVTGNWRKHPFTVKASWSGEEEAEHMGYLGSDLAVVLHGNVAGHSVDGSATFGGAEHDIGALFDDVSGEDDEDYGLGFFKRLSRAVKHPSRTIKSVASAATHPLRSLKGAARGVASVAKTISKNKTLIAVGGAALMAFPPTAPAGAAVLTAVATMKTAEAAIPKNASRAAMKLIAKRRENARKVVVNTATAAKAGNVDAQRAMKVFKTVRKARKRASARRQKFAFVVSRNGMVHRVK
jgi:hypothetical protein